MRPVAVFWSVVLCAGMAAADPRDQSEVERRAAAESTCAAHDANCDWVATFSSLERASIARALAARGYAIDPSPWGKTVAHIQIVNENVFAEDNWLQFFNFIHYTTRERAIRDELTLTEGDVWNDELVAESARRLRDPLYSSVVALIPVQSKQTGQVDVLVVTRDVWSLRLNTQYQYLSPPGKLTNLSISISENNFLGNRDVLAATMRMDLGAVAVGPLFIDKNVMGTHLYLSARVDAILTRETLEVFGEDPRMHKPSGDPGGIQDLSKFRREGSDSAFTLQYPLWSLASEWGGGVSFSHSNAVSRRYSFNGFRGYDDPATPINDLIPWEYELHTWTASASAVRQWGTYLKQQLSVGHSVTSVTPSLLPNFSPDPQLRADFMRDVFPRDERISAPFIEYAFFFPRYRTLRNVATYDLAEDARIGPDLDVSVSQGLHFLGSDYHFTSPSLSLGWTFPLTGDGYVRLSAGGSLRIQDAVSHGTPVASIDNSASAQIRAVTPVLRYARVIAQMSMATRWNDTQNGFLAIGADSGLRGYAINEFFGQRRVSSMIEARSLAIPVWVLRAGGVVFYECGGAADSLALMRLYQDVGFGLRVLIPQTSRDLFRFDLAFPLVGAPGWPAGHPHFLAGFESYF